MTQLFLDANILLDFFRFGDDDITEMGKLVTLIKDGDVTLHTNDHLLNEIKRNREKVVANSFAELRTPKYKVKPPNYCSELPELENLKEALKKANEAHTALITALEAKINSNDLRADLLIKDIFAKSIKLEITQEIMQRAQLRVALSNPPGKSGSLGDALHWECLLTMTHTYQMCIVSRDGDFTSELQPKNIKDFLLTEWKSRFGQHANIRLYRSLGEFFRSTYPDIKLSDEATKNDLISQLRTSPNFSTSHAIIADLSEFTFFTNAQVRGLFEALTENSQVGWIGKDADVHDFYLGLKDKSYLVNDEIQEAAAACLGVVKDDFFSPF